MLKWCWFFCIKTPNRECSEFRCKGIPEIFASAFSAYQTLVLAISGDQTAHLKWRLAHGEGAAVKKAKVVVLLIGTNDVSQLVDTEVGGWKTPAKEKVAEATVKTSAQVMTTRIQSVVENVKAINPAVKVVLLGLLPRGQAFRPPAFEWPNGIYTEIIGELNHNLAGRYEADGSVSFVECSEAFVDTPSGRVKKSMDKTLILFCFFPYSLTSWRGGNDVQFDHEKRQIFVSTDRLPFL